MVIGGRKYEIGDHIRIVSAKSVLHYDYGMTGNENKNSRGITGVIISESHYNENAVANLQVDSEYSGLYRNGMTRLFTDDEIEKLN